MKTISRALYTTVSTILQIVVDGARVFAVDALRDGFIDLRPLEKAGRALVVVAFAIVGAFILSLVFSEVLRVSGPLQPLRASSSAARGFMAPASAVPITYVALALAWSYFLTGAVQTRRLSRWLAFTAFTLFGMAALGNGMSNALFNSITQPVAVAAMVWLIAGAFVLLLIAYAALPRTRWPLAVRFSLIATLVTLILLPAVLQTAMAGNRLENQSVNDADSLNAALVLTRALLVPFLLVAGVEMYNFAQAVSGWLAQSTRRHAPARISLALLLIALVLRAVGLAQYLLSTPLPAWPWLEWLGAGLLLAGTAIVWAHLRRRPAAGAVPFGLIVGLIVIQSAMFLIVIPLEWLGSFVLMVYAGVTLNLEVYQSSAAALHQGVISLSDFYSTYALLVVALVCVGISCVARRRGQPPAVALFSALLAWSMVVRWLTRIDGPLAILHFSYAHLDALLIVVLIVATVWLLMQGEMTQDRAVRLLGITILTALLHQTGFLDNPFSPLFSAGGVLLLVIGIIWSVLTAGGRFLNADSAGFPRMSRALMYFGYIMLSLSVAHWFVVSHAVQQQAAQGDNTMLGFLLYGLTLAMWLLAQRGRPLLEEQG